LSRVIIQDHFAEFGYEFDQACVRALVKAAEVTREEAARTAPLGETGRLKASMHLSEIEPTLKGWRISVFPGMFYAKFVEYGTLGGRKKKLRRPEARKLSAEEGSGITPRYFMRDAGRNTEEALGVAIAEEIRRL
jgi:hypothetical protein